DHRALRRELGELTRLARGPGQLEVGGFATDLERERRRGQRDRDQDGEQPGQTETALLRHRVLLGTGDGCIADNPARMPAVPATLPPIASRSTPPGPASPLPRGTRASDCTCSAATSRSRSRG